MKFLELILFITSVKEAELMLLISGDPVQQIAGVKIQTKKHDLAYH